MPAGIRPTQNKVRKAVFDILGDIEGLSFLELFAGSAAVGFEAVSRGVSNLTLVEYNPECLKAIRKNIESLKLKSCSLYPKEAEDAVRSWLKREKPSILSSLTRLIIGDWQKKPCKCWTLMIY